VQPREHPVRRHCGEPLGVRPDDGDRGREYVGKLEIVDADERQLVPMPAQRPQRADRVAIVGSEDGGGASLLGQLEQIPQRGRRFPAW
jgi:hypothetical protein